MGAPAVIAQSSIAGMGEEAVLRDSGSRDVGKGASPAVNSSNSNIDVGNMMICLPLDMPSREQGEEAGDKTTQDAIFSAATSATQQLLAALFSLPSTPDKFGRVAQLPPPTTALPREKPLPQPKPPTKWQKFAQSKGIVKRKRSKLEFDEESGEWRRRHGYKRVRDEEEVAVIDAKGGEAPGDEDPFSSRKKEKKARVAKQQKNQLDNLKRAAKEGGKASLPSTVQLAAKALPIFDNPPVGGRSGVGKDEVKRAASFARTSTASGGKFDKQVAGEKKFEGKGKKRKFLPTVGTHGGSAEQSMTRSIVDKIIAKDDFNVLDVSKAVRKQVTADEGKKLKVKDSKGRSKSKKSGDVKSRAKKAKSKK